MNEAATPEKEATHTLSAQADAPEGTKEPAAAPDDALAGDAQPVKDASELPAVTAADVEEAMRDVIDPELGINIVDLGLVYGVTVDANKHAVLDMTLTSAACPLTDVIEDQTAAALDPITTGHTINWVWMPPWGPDKITDDGREMLRALGFNV